MTSKSLLHASVPVRPFRIMFGLIIGIVILSLLYYAVKQNLDSRSKAFTPFGAIPLRCTQLSCPPGQQKVPVGNTQWGGAGDLTGSTNESAGVGETDYCKCVLIPTGTSSVASSSGHSAGRTSDPGCIQRCSAIINTQAKTRCFQKCRINPREDTCRFNCGDGPK